MACFVWGQIVVYGMNGSVGFSLLGMTLVRRGLGGYIPEAVYCSHACLMVLNATT